MKTFFISLKISVVSLVFLTLLLGVIYPVFMWGVGSLFFHKHTNGTLFYHQGGKVLGSEWIAQNFSSDKYFHPRPSSAGDNGYDAASSSGSNLGPTSQKLIDSLTQRVKDFRSSNKWSGEIPADAVTASGSGLDPHISVKNAYIQASRVASSRSISQDDVEQLIKKYTERRTLWIFGEKRVNVLRINLALDKQVLKGFPADIGSRK